MKKLIFAFTGFLMFGFATVSANASVGTSFFQKGGRQISVTGGLGTAFQQDYFIVGLGVGYYLVNGLEVGLNAEGWFGNNPGIYKLTPQVRYVFYQFDRIHPYVGGFYRRTFYESLSDLDSYGSRIGAYLPMGNNAYLGFGYVFETYADCNEHTYSSCSTQYPELTFAVGF